MNYKVIYRNKKGVKEKALVEDVDNHTEAINLVVQETGAKFALALIENEKPKFKLIKE